MKMVCFCEKVHFRFLYTPPHMLTAQKNLCEKPKNLKPFYYLCSQTISIIKITITL